ncbi:MAG: oligosaccharide flippase family protein [Syntrophaceae bacterium]|nr:oligosaccharide flippase family protein [Syntrophaceae bacterium]
MTGFGGQAVLIISGILAARILGVEGRGYLALLIIFPVVLCQLGGLGLPQAVTYYTATNRENADAIYRLVKFPFLIQVTVLVCLHVFIVGIYVQQKPEYVALAGYLTLATIPGILAQQYSLALLQGLSCFRIFNIMRLMPAALYAGVIAIMFVAQARSLTAITLGWAGVNAIVGFVACYLAVRNVKTVQKTVPQPHSVPTLRSMLSFGIKGLPGTVSPLESFRIDQLVAGLLLSPSALGLYVVGKAFTNLPYFVAQSAGMIAYPAVSALQGTDGSVRTVWRFFWGVNALNLIIIVPLIILMPVLVPFFFGTEFSASVPVARMLLLGAFLLAARRILVEGMRGLGHPGVSTWAELSMYPWLILAVPFLVYQYGLGGLVVTVVFGHALALAVAAMLVWKVWHKRIHSISLQSVNMKASQ